MTTTTNAQQVKVNKVTQAQYDSMTKNENEFYVIVDKEYIDSITSSMVTSALGFTPVSSTVAVTHTASTAVGNSTVPVYINTSGVATTCKALNTAAYVADNTLVHLAGAETITGNKTFSGTTTISGTISLGSNATATTPTSSDNSTKVATTKFVKDQGYITGISSSDVTSALGFTPASSTVAVTHTASTAVGNSTVPVYINTSGVATTCKALNTAAYVADNTLVHLAGAETITGNKTFSGSVALGSSATATTPTVTSNDTTVATTKFVKDQGYQANVIETVKVNGTALTPSSKTVDIEALQNTATGTNGLTIGGTASTANSATNIGFASSAGSVGTAIGYNTAANGSRTTSIGYNARIGASVNDAIQIGSGTNPTAKTLCVGFYNSGNYPLLDGTTGLIPDDRLSSNIARTSVQTIQNTSALAASTSAVTYTVTDACSLYTLNLTANSGTITFNYSGASLTEGTTKAYTFELMLTMSTARSISFSGITWLDGEVPDLSAAGTYFFAFRKVGNGGWLGNLQGKW